MHRHCGWARTRFFKTAALFICAVALMACAAPGPDPQSDAPPLQILFIGNSHMYTNNLPGMFVKLAEAGGFSVKADMAAKPGYLLEEHVADPDTSEKIDGAEWDIVFLQENAGVPRLPFRRDEQMYPAARILHQRIESIGAQTIFFMTWASAQHIVDDRFDNFVDEQERVSDAYLTIAQELDAPVAPVGIAFQKSLQQRRDLFLWLFDHVHANRRGTYLAACVVYATVYQQSPEGLAYGAGLPEDTARFLQSIAAETVLAYSTP